MNSDKPILYRFPLCCLAFAENPRNRMLGIAAYCAMLEGFKRLESSSAEDVNTMIARRGKHELPGGFKRTNHYHIALVLGQAALGMQGGMVAREIEQWQMVSEFVVRFVDHFGRQPYATMRHDLVWEVINGKGISWSEFSILAAIYSWIGAQRDCAWITRSVIIRRSLGYKDAATMAAELGNRLDGAKPMTPRQVNYYLDKLHERRFFARVRPNPFRTYYSTRLNQDALEKRFVDRATYSQDFHERRRRRTAQFQARIRQAANVDDANVNNTGRPPSTLAIGKSVHGSSAETFTGASTNTSTLQNPYIKPFLKNPS